jgi:hypothetical protein
MAARFGGGADAGFLGCLAGDLDGFVIVATFDQHPAGGVAGLARIVEAMLHAAPDGGLVCIGEDQIGPLATKFQRHPLERFGRHPRDCLARAGRAGERDHLDIRMLGQLRAHPEAIAVHKVEHTRRCAGVMDEFGKEHRRQRRLFRRFQHHRAARQQRRDHLQRDLVHRPVPGRDQAHHADRLQRDPVVGGMGAERADELDLLEGLEEIFQVPRQAGGLTVAGHVDWRPHLEADGLAISSTRA